MYTSWRVRKQNMYSSFRCKAIFCANNRCYFYCKGRRWSPF